MLFVLIFPLYIFFFFLSVGYFFHGAGFRIGALCDCRQPDLDHFEFWRISGVFDYNHSSFFIILTCQCYSLVVRKWYDFWFKLWLDFGQRICICILSCVSSLRCQFIVFDCDNCCENATRKFIFHFILFIFEWTCKC